MPLRRWRTRAIREPKSEPRAVGGVAPTYAIRVPCPFALPMRPPVGRRSPPDPRAVSEGVAPMVNAFDTRTKLRNQNIHITHPAPQDPTTALANNSRTLSGR